MALTRSPLHDRHESLGAKLAEFGGWEMPVEYAAGVLAAAAALGVAVPDRLAVIGVDDDPLSAVLRPGITTVALDHGASAAELAELLLQRTAYARETLTALDGVGALHEQPVVREFALDLDVAGTDAVRRVIARCQDAGVNPGYALGRDYEELPTGLLVAITEQRTRADIDRLAQVLGDAVAAERAAAPAGQEVRA